MLNVKHFFKLLALCMLALAMLPSVASGADGDGDGIDDTLDNCRASSNPNQLDSDGDGFGNVCDADYDNNNIVDSADFTAFQALFDIQDPGADLNGDGQVNLSDLGAFNVLFGNPPGPGAGAEPVSTVEGRITDIAGIVVPSATVTVYEEGVVVQASTAVDAQGAFALSLTPNVEYSLLVEAPGFADQVVPVESPSAGGQISIDSALIARGEPITISSSGGLAHTGEAGATVTVDKDDFVDALGNPVTGDIQLTITPVDVSNTAAVAAFPGSFAGVPEGESDPALIVSLGVVEYEFTANGQPVNLAPGATAEIVVPIYVTTYPDGSAIQIGQTIPLWSLNEATSIWEQEGEGTVIASSASPTGLAFQATVTHFSWWNCDVAPEMAQVEITVLGPCPGGNATIFANAPGLVNWQGENASTTINVGGTTLPLKIPAASFTVCFQATIFCGGIVMSDIVCVQANPGALISVTLVAGDEGPLILGASPDAQSGTVAVTARTGQAIPPVRIFPLTLENSVSYAITAGLLPSGLSLDTSGTAVRIVGTPTADGDFSVTVTGTDADGNTDAVTVTYAIAVCGNSIIEYPEQCDDGNNDPDDGCSPSCRLPIVPASVPFSSGPFSMLMGLSLFGAAWLVSTRRDKLRPAAN